MSKFYDNQINTSDEIVKIFDVQNWVLLIAELQSGKTGTHTLTAFEMFRLKKTKEILIICGSSEKQLKSQVNEDLKENIHNYRKYLRYKVKDMNADDIDDLCYEIDKNVQVYFSHDLKDKKNIKKYKTKKDLIIIWEESHYAQDVENRPNSFLNKIGISANGKKEYTEKRNIKVLSVSATPFSEFSDYNQYSQNKGTVYMTPSSDYIGVKQFQENKCFIGFENPMDAFEDILKNNKNYVMASYVMARGTSDKQDEAKKLCLKYGWKYETIDMNNKEFVIKELENEPSENKVIFIKNMFKMGKVVPKKHVSSVINMNSKTSNTDSLLQGLTGRMCGYTSKGANTNVKIYLHKNFTNSDEISKYIEFHDKKKVIPNKSNNIDSERTTHVSLKHTIPIKIESKNFDCKNCNDKESIISSVVNCVNNNLIQNHNNNIVSNDIRYQVNNIKDGKYDFSIRKHCVPSYKEGPKNIGRMFNDRNSSGEYGQSCGFNQNDSTKRCQILCWIIENDDYLSLNIKKGDVFLLFRVENNDADIAKTKDKCAFHQDIIEDDESEETNGNYRNRLPCDSGCNVNVMENFIMNCIKLSIDPDYPNFNARCIKPDTDKAYKGIMVNTDVLNAIKKNGTIYNKCLKTFKVKLKVTKNYNKLKGQSSDIFRLSKIEW